ncbi:MAG TPA: hypothetical protein DCY88_16670 [Cyanobacteria bacterium UBA11372]|nr:hypothetical protein [Cyanobacteria bacterium UBA11372]
MSVCIGCVSKGRVYLFLVLLATLSRKTRPYSTKNYTQALRLFWRQLAISHEQLAIGCDRPQPIKFCKTSQI